MTTRAGVAARDDPPAMNDEPMIKDPANVVVAAYLLAAVCLIVPFAVIGALFAGVALARRNRPGAGAGVIALGVACTALAVVVLR